MSWDLVAYSKDPVGPAHPLGTVEAIRTRLEQDPRIEWADHWWGYIEGEGFRIDVNIGSFDSEDSDVIDHLGIEVRGNGDPLPLLCALAEKCGWKLEDLATGDLIDCDAPSRDGWDAFQRARELAIRKANKEHTGEI